MYIVARACTMDSEEMAKKCDLKSLKMIAKRYGVNISCAKKIDLVTTQPPEVMAGLEAPKA